MVYKCHSVFQNAEINKIKADMNPKIKCKNILVFNFTHTS